MSAVPMSARERFLRSLPRTGSGRITLTQLRELDQLRRARFAKEEKLRIQAQRRRDELFNKQLIERSLPTADPFVRKVVTRTPLTPQVQEVISLGVRQPAIERARRRGGQRAVRTVVRTAARRGRGTVERVEKPRFREEISFIALREGGRPKKRKTPKRQKKIRVGARISSATKRKLRTGELLPSQIIGFATASTKPLARTAGAKRRRTKQKRSKTLTGKSSRTR